MNTDIALEKGLPSNLDAERFVLGAILSDSQAYPEVASVLLPPDFFLEKHRRIFMRMGELFDRQEQIDRVTVANELMRLNQLESVDGVTYLVSMDEGLPAIANIQSYLRIIKEKSDLRRIAFLAQRMIDRAIDGREDSREILNAVSTEMIEIADNREESKLKSALSIVEDYPGGIDGLLQSGAISSGLPTGFENLDRMNRWRAVSLPAPQSTHPSWQRSQRNSRPAQFWYTIRQCFR